MSSNPAARLQSIKPATGQVLREYASLDDAALEATIAGAAEAQAEWKMRSVEDRCQGLLRAATRLRERSEALAVLMAEEMGKPLTEGRSEAEKCAWACEYYAANAPGFLAPRPVETGASRSYVAQRPLGLILGIMPWNFPFWQAIRFAAPALAAGNGLLLKHAPNVQGCAEAVVELFESAGFPKGIFANLPIEVHRVGGVVDDPRVAAVSLTGSTEAGRAVAARAGQALKKSVLELGGSDANLVLEDADLEAAAQAIAIGRMINAGQSCIAAKRIIVVESVRERFEDLLLECLSALRCGDPLDPDTDLGPMARADLRANLHRQVEESVNAGAKLRLGGEMPEGQGYFYPATLLTRVGPGMPAYDEEVFGPVASVLPAADEAEAIRIANDSAYGLGAAVFTADLDRGERIAADLLEAGCGFVNTFVRSDPRLPFGGVRASGYGRELGEAGIREFVNQKTVYIA